MSSPHKNAIHLVFKKLQNTYNKWCHGVLHKRLRPNIHNIHNESLKVAHCKRKGKKKNMKLQYACHNLPIEATISIEWFMLYSKDFIRKGHGWNSISLLMKKTKNRIKKLTQLFSWEKKKNHSTNYEGKTSEEYWTLVHLNLEFQVLHAAICLHK
jgi:hypothetical protein